MTVSELIIHLKKFEAIGYGGALIYYRHGASGDCGPVGTPHVTTRVDDQGPFDLREGEEYMSLYVGH